MNKVVTKFLDWVSVLVRPVIRVALNRLSAKGLLKVKVKPDYSDIGQVSGYDVQLLYLDKQEEVLFDTSVRDDSISSH